jgi:hypothetical protein
MKSRALLPLLACLFLAGCEIPAQTYWSPDGSKAAHVAPSNPNSPAVLINDAGAIVANLGQSIGGFAWSADSNRLYFANTGCNPNANTGFETQGAWLNAAEADDDTPPDNNEKNGLTVSVWQDGKTTPLFWIDRGAASYMALSPDQNWIALVSTSATGGDGDTSVLHLYSIASKRLYPLCVGCTRGICFTGPNRLAFIEPHDVHKGKPSDIGQLVEVTLLDKPDKPDRQPLLETLLPVTTWLQAAGEDILFTSVAFTFPAPPPKDGSDLPHSLFRYSRAQKTAKPLATDVLEYFSISPDGKRVLLATPIRAANDDHPTQLAVMELASGALHPLRNLASTVKLPPNSQFTGIPAYPAWRNNDQISFSAAIDPKAPSIEQGSRFYFDLVLYQLTADYKLTALRTLSEKWPLESKPSFRKDN